MKRYNHADAMNIVLMAGYETLVRHAEFDTLSAVDIQKRVEEHFSVGYVHRLLFLLAKEGLVDVDQMDEMSSPRFTLSDKGLLAADEFPSLSELLTQSSQVVPAADRVVSIDHNNPIHKEISEGLNKAIKEASELQSNEFSADEQKTAIANLKSAKALWESLELSKMQAEVGIVMAIERAEQLLSHTFRLASKELLLEAIRLLFKTIFGPEE